MPKRACQLFYTHLLPSGLSDFAAKVNRWSRSCAGSAGTSPCPVADYTASGESHPALKTSLFQVCEPIICRRREIVNRVFRPEGVRREDSCSRRPPPAAGAPEKHPNSA